MNILVVGCGKVGSKLAADLWNEGHHVSVVDNKPELFNNLPVDFNGLCVTGVPIDNDVLKEAGIEEADAVAAVTQDDNINIMVSQVARHIFNKNNVLARIYDPQNEEVFNHFGLDTICPTNVTVDRIKNILYGKQEGGYQEIQGSVFSFKEFRVTNEMDGIPVSQLKYDEGFMVFCLKRNSKTFLANEVEVLRAGDIVVFVQKVD